MSRRAAFTIGSLLALFPLYCFGGQPVPGSEAAWSGLCGPVSIVLTEIFTYNDNGQRTPGSSQRAIYDRNGYQTELYKFDSRGRLRQHTVYTRNCRDLLKTETTSPVCTLKSVQIFNSAGAVTETDTYDSHGTLSARSPHVAPAKTESGSLSTTKSTDGSISTLERFRDGSFKESTVKPDGTKVVHSHSPTVDWRQVTDSNNRSLDYIEDLSSGKYLRISSHYSKAGRQEETDTYDRSGKLKSEVTFQYPEEDKHGNWTEQQIWAKNEGKAARLVQVTHRTITYYPHTDGER